MGKDRLADLEEERLRLERKRDDLARAEDAFRAHYEAIRIQIEETLEATRRTFDDAGRSFLESIEEAERLGAGDPAQFAQARRDHKARTEEARTRMEAGEQELRGYLDRAAQTIATKG